MFYSHQILAKKGPLGTIWIAAHMDRKLRKNQIHETSITASVDTILMPQMPLALRLSGQLMLGVVRIYSRQVNYLFTDCSEALVKFKQVMRPGVGLVELPAELGTAPFNAVTLPDQYEALNISVDQIAEPSKGDAHTSKRADITLQEVGGEESLSGAIALGEARFGAVEDGEVYIEMGELELDEYVEAGAPGAAHRGATLLDEYDLGDAAADQTPAPGGSGGLELVDMDELLDEEDAPLPAGRDVQESNMNDLGLLTDMDEPELFRDATAPAAFPTPLATPAGGTDADGSIPGSLPKEVPVLTPLQVALGMSTPRRSTRIADATTPSTGSDGLPLPDVRFGDFTVRVQASVAKAAPPRRRAAEAALRKRRLATDDEVILSNEHIRNQLKSAADIMRKRTCPGPGLRRALHLADRAPTAATAAALCPAVGAHLCPALYGLFEANVDVGGASTLLPWSVAARATEAGARGRPKRAVEAEEGAERDCDDEGEDDPHSAGKGSARGRKAARRADAVSEASEGPTNDLEDVQLEAPDVAHDGDSDFGHDWGATPGLPEFDDEAATRRQMMMGAACGEPGGGGAQPASEGVSAKLAAGASTAAKEAAAPSARRRGGGGGGGGGAEYTRVERTTERTKAMGDPDTEEEAAARLSARVAKVGGMTLGDALHVGDGAAEAEAAEVETAAARELPAGGIHGSEVGPDEAGPPEGAWSQRTKSVLAFMKGQFKARLKAGGRGADVRAYEMLEGMGSREAARCFFELLLLNNKGYVTLKQPEAFGDISVYATSRTLRA